MDTVTWSSGDNRATVRALLVHRLKAGNQPTKAVHPYYQPWASSSSSPAFSAPASASAAKPKASHAGDAKAPPPGCPMHAGGGAGGSMSSTSAGPSATIAKLNPLNNMPTLSQDRAVNQKVDLSTERTKSSIPRLQGSAAPGASPYDGPASSGSGASACPVPHDERAKVAGEQAKGESPKEEGVWEYPSPQQFYNALVRKGWETPEEHVEMMVMVHNFLNERAWLEVLQWELEMGVAAKDVALARFQGRPGTLSPKARLYSWAAALMPATYSSEPPFDRHDWIVRRPSPTAGGAAKEVRYVIDYYSEPDDPDTDEPVFVLDVRPALDSFEAFQARMRRTWNEWNAKEESASS